MTFHKTPGSFTDLVCDDSILLSMGESVLRRLVDA